MPILKLVSFAALLAIASAQTFVNQTTCNGKTYTYQELAGYGFVPSNARDEFGDTLGTVFSLYFLPKYTSLISHDNFSFQIEN
jgi:hypothetical protein